jgi:predicted pyridoxine 5'-phosphate oxidase superfamily flavin-nucleotide-binding protein
MPLPATHLPDLDQDLVTSVEELEGIVGTPAPLSLDKVSPVLTPGMQAFVTQSPFYLLGTSSDDGPCDVSPRGDPAGAVLVRDDRTLLLPEGGTSGWIRCEISCAIPAWGCSS